MAEKDQPSVEFSFLFEALRESEKRSDVMAVSGTSFEELDSIRVLREAVEETVEPQQCYLALS